MGRMLALMSQVVYCIRKSHSTEPHYLTLFKEIMVLTKMNYNNADIADGEPITLKFVRKVGEILSYIPENEDPPPSYRFYM